MGAAGPDGAWEERRSDTLVVACSDGQFQENLDAFVCDHLGITQYDRLYVPGGAGALCSSGIEFTRAHQVRKECTFLISAHAITRAVLMFHGPLPGGPDTAVCGDYRRKLPGRSAADIRRQQEHDAREILRAGLGPGVRVELLRYEVGADGVVRFSPLAVG